MKLGAETNTRWLWFITYILLPLNVVTQTILFFAILDKGSGGVILLFLFAEIGLAVATIIGLHTQKSWGWYCIMVMFGIQLIVIPIRVHVKDTMRHELLQSSYYSYHQNQKHSSKPDFFDLKPMLAFFLTLAFWTVPNFVYMYKRRRLFGIADFAWVPSFAKGVNSHCTTTGKVNATRGADFVNEVKGLISRQADSWVSEKIDDAPLYEKALLELESENLNKALWAKAIAMADGDQPKAKARYIKMRVAALLAEETKRIKQEESCQQKARKLSLVEKKKQELKQFASRFAVGRYIPALYKHYGDRVARMSTESDESYAKRLEKFISSYEAETGRSIDLPVVDAQKQPTSAASRGSINPGKKRELIIVFTVLLGGLGMWILIILVASCLISLASQNK